MNPARKIGLAGLVALLASGAVTAQDPPEDAPTDSPDYPAVYRVEVIVFGHRDGHSDRMRAPAPADFSANINPLVVARANRMVDHFLAALDRAVPLSLAPGEADETTPYLESGQRTIRPIPPVYAELGDLSAPLQGAFTRLTDAPDYEPLATRTWIQLAQPDQTTAPMRLHDRTVIDTTASRTTRRALFSGERLVTADGRARFRPLFARPDPALAMYRLDGTVQLRKRRFLHLDVDLVWQAPARALGRRTSDGTAEPTERREFQRPAEPTGMSARRAPPTGQHDDSSFGAEWHLHRLQQSRVVEPGRFEYFDSELFGVLVRIEEFEQVVPEIEETEVAEPGAESQPDAADGPAAEQPTDSGPATASAT